MLNVRLHRLLDEIRSTGGELFSGIGLLVSCAPDDLPIMSLRPAFDRSAKRSTVEVLAEVSQSTSEYHDGFHVLSPDFRVARFSVYFSPPIMSEVGAGPRHLAGGRYWAARFGSALPAVLVAGVASTRYGVVVFEAGREVLSP